MNRVDTKLTLGIVRALHQSRLFRLSSAEIVIRDEAGTYGAEVFGPVLESLESIERKGVLDQIRRLGGFVHDNDWTTFAPTIVDDAGFHLSSDVSEDLRGLADQEWVRVSK